MYVKSNVDQKSLWDRYFFLYLTYILDISTIIIFNVFKQNTSCKALRPIDGKKWPSDRSF